MPIRLHDGTLHYSFFESEPTPDLMARRAAKIEAWYRQHPETRDAPQPPELARVNGRFSLNPKAEFAALAEQAERGELFLRDPAQSTDGLLNSYLGGHCLHPILRDCDQLGIDPRAVPADGDFVLLILPPAHHQFIENTAREDQQFLRWYGGRISPIVIKRVRTMGAERFYCTNRGAFDWNDARVLGIVRRVERDGKRIYDPHSTVAAYPPGGGVSACAAVA